MDWKIQVEDSITNIAKLRGDNWFTFIGGWVFCCCCWYMYLFETPCYIELLDIGEHLSSCYVQIGYSVNNLNHLKQCTRGKGFTKIVIFLNSSFIPGIETFLNMCQPHFALKKLKFDFASHILPYIWEESWDNINNFFSELLIFKKLKLWSNFFSADVKKNKGRHRTDTLPTL